MRKSEKLIKVCEVLRSKVYKTVIDDWVDPDVSIYDFDIEDTGINLHGFSSALYDLHNAGFVDVEAVYEPINPKWDNKDIVDIYPIETLQDPSLRFKVFAKGDLGQLISNLDKGIPFEDLTPKALNFDQERSVLEVRGNIIRIARQSDRSVDHYILEFLSKENFKQEYSYSELRENEVYDKNVDLSTYINSCRTLNKKIDRDTKGKIKDFLMFGKTIEGSMKVNPVYLVS